MREQNTCGICQGGCRVITTVENGVLTRVEPDRESPRGRLCPRGALAPSILYGEQRIARPLVRDGAHGEGELRKATWDEALGRAARLLEDVARKHGSRAIASYFGRGVLATPVTRLGMGADTLLTRLGSPNDMNCASICNLASNTVTPVTTLGIGVRGMVQDVEHSDLIVAWGKNSTTDDGPQTMLRRIEAAQRRGAKLIVIDPRQSGLGERADWWVPVTPGADGALALALLKLIVDEERYDTAFVRDFTRGFDEFKAYLDTLDTRQLSRWCGVSPEDVRALADLLCSTQKASLISYTGLEYQLSAVQNNRAIYVLWALTGKLDVEGGIYLSARNAPVVQLKDLPEGDQPIGAAEFPLFYRFTGEGQFSRFPHAVLDDDPYPVRALLVVGGSPAVSFPDSASWRAAYGKLECLVVVDRFFTEETRFADVVLPACTLYETPRLESGPEGPVVREAVLAPAGEARNDVLILSELAERLGAGAGFPQTEEELRSWLTGGAIPYAGDFVARRTEAKRSYCKYLTGELRADGKPGFPTPSGKFEICSTYLEESGFTPYPEYRDIRSLDVFADPTLTFTLTTGARSDTRMGAFGANLPGIAAIEPCPLADVAAEDARELGIEDGGRVRVTTPFGSGVYTARVGGMARGAVHLPHGGGSSFMPKAWRDGNVNDLCSLDYQDPVTGFVTTKSVPCRVEKA